MRRKNIHSLLTLAAEPSMPNVGARGGHAHDTVRKERAAGVVPAFTLLKRKNQVHFAWAWNTTVRSPTHKLKASEVTRCARGFSIGVALSVWTKSCVFNIYSVPVSQLKCKTCVGHILVSAHNNMGAARDSLLMAARSQQSPRENKLIKKRDKTVEAADLNDLLKCLGNEGFKVIK